LSEAAPAAVRSRTAERVVAVLAVLAVGAAVSWHVLAAARAGGRQAAAERVLRELGGEPRDEPLGPSVLAATLEPPPGVPARAGERYLATVPPGQIVLLNFWATWCPPCIDELPSLVRLAGAVADRDVAVVAVSYDEGWEPQRATLQRVVGAPLPPGVVWLRDPQGQDGDEARMLRTHLGTQKLPETWVLRDGRVLARFVGAQQWDSPTMQRYLRLLAEARP
jgi:thiol-disulfide isomerase/thioredoxin